MDVGEGWECPGPVFTTSRVGAGVDFTWSYGDMSTNSSFLTLTLTYDIRADTHFSTLFPHI